MAYLDSASGGGKDTSGAAGGLSGLLSNNNFGALVAGGAGLIPSILNANQPLPYQTPLTNTAGNLGTVSNTAGGENAALFNTGSNLISALTTGQLPSGANDVVNQIVEKQTADTKAKYASLDQTGSTMEQSALNDINTNKGALTFQIAQQMAQTGLQATSQSIQALNVAGNADAQQAGIYESLMKAQMTQNTNLMSSISSFSSAFAKALPAIAAA
jgi:hypothetical protein